MKKTTFRKKKGGNQQRARKRVNIITFQSKCEREKMKERERDRLCV